MALCSRNEFLGGGESVVMLVPQESVNKIQRIPSFLRGSNSNGDYDPKVISLGPYHHGKPELQPLQRFKHKVFDNFIFGSPKDANFYRKKVLEVVDEARRCYVEGATDEFDDSQFAEMMLLDSCFLLFYILSTMHGFKDFWNLTTVQLSDQIGYSGDFFLQLDTFLLENQIPLWIVEFLFNARFGSFSTTTTGRVSWKYLLVNHCQTSLFAEKYRVDEDRRDHEKPLHLLEAFHMHMVGKCEMLSSSNKSAGRWQKLRPIRTNNTLIVLQKEAFEKYSYIFRSVMDLKSKGIRFGHSDNIYSVMSIKFESYYVFAKLKLPIWYASSSSRVFLSNMIAYELCPNNRTCLEVTSYINFMKSLIVCPNDVKELREKRIISNTLGDDMEVVKLFKGLNTHGIDNPDIFSEVKQKLQKHYDSRAKTWMAEFVYTYLISPWSIIALLSAFLLLLLTSAQTYVAFNPSKKD
ncbi:PREDICTED: UPF0481 protein At3g47200-like [Ipomoea nil]|uniref:UPF0481 protein At3g47200-like n=1 Tax=Ipomoea nil TaxID=35883 RepID=UPI000901FAFD|nr:PREDICTED: UPF0481 protein At3g47200-like [Ipomoea nil]